MVYAYGNMVIRLRRVLMVCAFGAIVEWFMPVAIWFFAPCDALLYDSMVKNYAKGANHITISTSGGKP